MREGRSARARRPALGNCTECGLQAPLDILEPANGDLLCESCHRGLLEEEIVKSRGGGGAGPEDESALRDRLLQADFKRMRSPQDLELLKELVEICERLGDEDEAAEYRRQICLIDPAEPSIQGKEIAQREPLAKGLGAPYVPPWQEFDRLKRYPFLGLGGPVLFGGAVFLFLGRWCAGVAQKYAIPPLNLIIAGFLLMALWGFILSYFLKITERSAQGDEEPPDWTDFLTFFHSIVTPFFSCLSCFAATMGPLAAWFLLCALLLGFNVVTIPILIALGLFGLYTAPMAYLVLARVKRIGAAANYVLVWSAIGKVRPSYSLLLVGLLAIIIANLLLAGAMGLIFRLDLLGPIIYYSVTSFAWLYSGMIAFHLLGRFYLPHGRKLNWFEEVLEPDTPAPEEP